MVSLAPSVESACLHALPLQLRGCRRGCGSAARGRRAKAGAGGLQALRGSPSHIAAPWGQQGWPGTVGALGASSCPRGAARLGPRAPLREPRRVWLGSEAVGGAGRVAAGGSVVEGLSPLGFLVVVESLGAGLGSVPCCAWCWLAGELEWIWGICWAHGIRGTTTSPCAGPVPFASCSLMGTVLQRAADLPNKPALKQPARAAASCHLALGIPFCPKLLRTE